MKYMKFLSTISLLALGVLLLPSGARALDNVQRRTKMAVSEHTEIPGAVLHPGTYMVKVVDFKDGKEIVQFTNEEETKVIATVLAIRDRRARTDDGKSGFVYFQREEGAPMLALKSWYDGEDDFGELFVYPKAEAFKLAEATREEVEATPAPTPTLQSEVTVVKPEAAPAPTKLPESLPKTGSHVPLIALIGLGALAGAAALRLSRRAA